MVAYTPNFDFALPTIAGDVNVWGEYINEQFTTPIDALLRRFMNTFINSTPPAEAQAGTFWIDNTSDPWIWSMFDGTDWIEVGQFDITNHTFTVSAGGGGGFFVGDLKNSGQTADHGNWLVCDGRAISRTAYSGLFDLYNSYTNPLPYGNGDGSTTFNLPDMRGRVPGGVGTGSYSGASTRSYGEAVGGETTMLTASNIPAGAPVSTSGANPQGFDILVSTKPNPLYPSINPAGTYTRGLHNRTEYSSAGGVVTTPFGQWRNYGNDDIAANYVSLVTSLGNTGGDPSNYVNGMLDLAYSSGTGSTTRRAFIGYASIVSTIAQNQVTFGTATPNGGQTGTPVMQPTLFTGNWFVYAT